MVIMEKNRYPHNYLHFQLYKLPFSDLFQINKLHKLLNGEHIQCALVLGLYYISSVKMAYLDPAYFCAVFLAAETPTQARIDRTINEMQLYSHFAQF